MTSSLPRDGVSRYLGIEQHHCAADLENVERAANRFIKWSGYSMP